MQIGRSAVFEGYQPFLTDCSIQAADAVQQRDAALCSSSGVGQRSDVGLLKAFPKVRCWLAHAPSSSLHQSGACATPNFLFILLPQLRGTVVQPSDSALNTSSCASAHSPHTQPDGDRVLLPSDWGSLDLCVGNGLVRLRSAKCF